MSDIFAIQTAQAWHLAGGVHVVSSLLFWERKQRCLLLQEHPGSGSALGRENRPVPRSWNQEGMIPAVLVLACTVTSCTIHVPLPEEGKEDGSQAEKTHFYHFGLHRFQS